MNKRRAFTLVEILTVVVIIGILASLITVAVAGAMRAAKRGRAAVEMNTISMALEHYKAEIGEYPPDFFDDAALVRHVRKRWPRFELPTNVDDVFLASGLRLAIARVYQNQNVYPANVMVEWIGRDPNRNEFQFVSRQTNISALVIWLGGYPNRDGQFEGFSADPEAPFGRYADGTINGGVWIGGTPVAGDPNTLQIETPDKKVFMDLRVNKNVFFYSTLAPNSRVDTAPCLGTTSGSTILPIVYFRGRASGGVDAYYEYANDTTPPRPQIKFYNFTENIASNGTASGCVWAGCGVVVPYAKSGAFNANLANSTIIWNNPTTYQLIHPGLDGKFGDIPDVYERVINPGTGIGAQDLDNITNISDNKELQSILP